MLNKEGGSEHSSYTKLKKSSNINGTIVGCPGIEAVFDAFGIVVDSIERFETALRPSLHIALLTV